MEARLAELLADCRARWPGVNLDGARYLAHLAARAAAEGIAVEQLRAPDLFLALACADGDPAALAFFEREILAHVGEYVSRVAGAARVLDELRQRLRVHLLVGGERPPRILEYSGRGALGGWVRVAAVRQALNLLQRGDNPRAFDDGALVADAASPEVQVLKARYRGEFESAVETALAALGTRDHNLLRLCFVEGLGVEQIARAYNVHRTTVTRWLAAARRELMARTRELLRDRLSVTSSELESLVRLVQSELAISISHALQNRVTPA
jgi:RNA polymerase sigma-70 factor (ECF subfamily)